MAAKQGDSSEGSRKSGNNKTIKENENTNTGFISSESNKRANTITAPPPSQTGPNKTVFSSPSGKKSVSTFTAQNSRKESSGKDTVSDLPNQNSVKYCLVHSDASKSNLEETSNKKTVNPDTNNSEQKQKIIMPVPSYNLDSTGDNNRPLPDLKESHWDDRVIVALSGSNMDNKESHFNSTEDNDISVKWEKTSILTFDSDKSNIDSLYRAGQNIELNHRDDKIIIPVPNNALEDKKVSGWDEKILVPAPASENVSMDTHLSADQDREIIQDSQKVIMPIHYSSMNNVDLQSPVGSHQSEYPFKLLDATSLKTEEKEQLSAMPCVDCMMHGNYHSTTKILPGKTKVNEEMHSTEHIKGTEVNTTAQPINESNKNYDEVSESTDHVIHGVLEDTRTPQKVSPSDRKQLFGDPRKTVLTLSEIEQQTENIKNYLTKKEQKDVPSKIEVSGGDISDKVSSAPVSEIVESERETRKQKIANDIKQQQLADRKAMKQPMGFKSSKKEAKPAGSSESKNIDFSKIADNFKDTTAVKKEAASKSGEQPSHSEENIQKTSVAQFLYNKLYKDSGHHKQSFTEKPASNVTKDLDQTSRDLVGKAPPSNSKEPHNISAMGITYDGIETGKSSELLGKKEKGHNKITGGSSGDLNEYANKEGTSATKTPSDQEGTGVKYVVSEGKTDNKIQKQVLGDNIKNKATDQGGPKSEISDIKRINRDEASFEKEQGRMADDNIHAIEKYLQQEISSVSPEKARGNMTELNNGMDSQTGEHSGISSSNAKAESEEKKKERKHSAEQNVDEMKKKLPNKHDNLQSKTNVNETDIPLKHQKMKRAEDGTANPGKHNLVTEQQKKPHQRGSPSKASTSSETGKADMHSSTFEKYSTGNNEMTEQTFHDKYHRFIKEEGAKTTNPQKPDDTNVTNFVSHYSTTDRKDIKLDHHNVQHTDQKKESNKQFSLATKTVSQRQVSNFESNDSSGNTSQSITLQDTPPKYMVKDINENEIAKTADDAFNPRKKQNIAWPVHQLSSVNKKYLGKPVRPSSWGDAGTFLPWVSYVSPKKNDQNTIVAEKAEGHNSHQANGYGFGNQFWQFVGRQYDFFKENFNSHTLRGRANVAKATLLAVGLFTMWQVFKPKRHDLAYQRCSECGSVNTVEKTH